MSEKIEKTIRPESKPESKEEEKLKITIVDDDVSSLAAMERLFSIKNKYEVSGLDNPVHSVEEAVDLIQKILPNAVVLDMNLTDKYEKEGLEVAKIIKEKYPGIEIIINSTDWGDPELKETFEELGIKRGISKARTSELPKILEEWEKEETEKEKERQKIKEEQSAFQNLNIIGYDVKELSTEKAEEILRKSHYNKDFLMKVYKYEPSDLVYSIKKDARMIKQIVKYLKNEDFQIFAVTEISTTPYGYAIKAAWKEFCPDKRLKVMPINVKGLKEAFYKDPFAIEGELKRIVGDFRKRLEKFHLDPQKTKVLIFDEHRFIARTIQLAKEVMRRVGVNYEALVGGVSDKYHGTAVETKEPHQEIFWKESATRATNAYGEGAPKLLTRVPRVRREEAKAMIYDMKLIGKEAGRELKEEKE